MPCSLEHAPQFFEAVAEKPIFPLHDGPYRQSGVASEAKAIFIGVLSVEGAAMICDEKMKKQCFFNHDENDLSTYFRLAPQELFQIVNQVKSGVVSEVMQGGAWLLRCTLKREKS